MKTRMPIRCVAAAGAAITLLCAAPSLLADAPQAVTITTQVIFNPSTNGTFVATGPICSTGTVSLVREVAGVGLTGFNVNALQQFVCDDNSGSLILRLHPQANGRPTGGFTATGPWSVWGKGTGNYRSLSGHGDFGVVLDFNSNPVEGVETYVGFVNL